MQNNISISDRSLSFSGPSLWRCPAALARLGSYKRALLPSSLTRSSKSLIDEISATDDDDDDDDESMRLVFAQSYSFKTVTSVLMKFKFNHHSERIQSSWNNNTDSGRGF